jgi:uncharacterized damage-inducible protein DinB
MLDELTDLFAHQEWADSVHWRALAAHPGALDDEGVRNRLYHIHAVQRSFLDVWKGSPRWPPGLKELGSMDALKRLARDYYGDLAGFLRAVPRARLDEALGVPWFPDPKRPIRLGETMQQVVMHSEHHRGQNAVRLRELGGAMPPTDYIYWIVEGRAAPVWG